jgi:hypothetical protein
MPTTSLGSTPCHNELDARPSEARRGFAYFGQLVIWPTEQKRVPGRSRRNRASSPRADVHPALRRIAHTRAEMLVMSAATPTMAEPSNMIMENTPLPDDSLSPIWFSVGQRKIELLSERSPRAFESPSSVQAAMPADDCLRCNVTTARVSRCGGEAPCLCVTPQIIEKGEETISTFTDARYSRLEDKALARCLQPGINPISSRCA